MNRVPQALHHTGEILIIIIIIIIIIKSDTTLDLKNFFLHKFSKKINEKLGKKWFFPKEKKLLLLNQKIAKKSKARLKDYFLK
jgi:hypothetical protein